MPSEDAWNTEIAALVADSCGQCHGEVTQSGAPFSLVDYEALVAGDEGGRIVDRIGLQVEQGTMPPIGFDQPDIPTRQAIAGWASCGERTVEDTSGVGASRPVFGAPEDPPADTEVIDITADNFAVLETFRDHYEEIDFVNVVEEDVFIRRIDSIVDASRVLHHLTLRRSMAGDDDPLSMRYLYAWAPGTGAIEFPGGGIRLGPGDRLRLQIHYNNSAGIEDVTDSSGVRLWVGAPEGREYAMVDPGPGAQGFRIPARSSETIASTCQITEDVRLVAAMPHMHEIGQSFELNLKRSGETDTDTILSLDAWSFETQLFYDLPIRLREGDELTVRCDFDNPGDTDVRAGGGTADEMCYAFTYVTPPVETFCTIDGGEGEIDYSPGMCVAEPVDAAPVRGTFVLEEDGPTFSDTMGLPEGQYTVATTTVASPNSAVQVASFTVAGQVSRVEDLVTLDGAVFIQAPIDGLRSGVQSDLSLRGPIATDLFPAMMTSTECNDGGEIEAIRYGVTTDGTPAVAINIDGAGFPITLWLMLEPVE